MFVCLAGSLPCERRGHCVPQVVSVSPPLGNGVGDVTNTVQPMFLVYSFSSSCILLLAEPMRSLLGVRLCAPICVNQGWRHQPCVSALVFKRDCVKHYYKTMLVLINNICNMFQLQTS